MSAASLEGVVRELLGTVARALDDEPGSHDAYVRVGAVYLQDGFDRKLREALGGESPASADAEAKPFATIIAPFTKCANCGSTAAENATWNRTGGWTCSACGESDYPEAAE